MQEIPGDFPCLRCKRMTPVSGALHIPRSAAPAHLVPLFERHLIVGVCLACVVDVVAGHVFALTPATGRGEAPRRSGEQEHRRPLEQFVPPDTPSRFYP